MCPLREFGKEHHRKLSSLPQTPQLASAPASRLLMSWWDREVNVWRLSGAPGMAEDAPDASRHRLGAKVLFQVGTKTTLVFTCQWINWTRATKI